MSAKDDSTEKAFWDAAKGYAADSLGAKGELAEAARKLAGKQSDAPVYVAKLTAQGLNNQLWQGKSISESNDLMVFVGPSLGTTLPAVRERLSPRPDSGFESVVIGKPSPDGGWVVHEVVQYDHSDIGQQLQQQLGLSFPIIKVSDPAALTQDAQPLPSYSGDLSSAFSADTDETTADEVVAHLHEAKNVVLEGPPGTGKTRLAFLAADLLAGSNADPFRLETVLKGSEIAKRVDELRDAPLIWEVVQFHPGFGYDDFVRGVRTDPDSAGFILKSVDGVLPKMAEVAILREGKPTLLIIDEINRGNLSAVLGETIFAIDPAHRGEEVRLQYPAPSDGEEGLRVPPNLYLLATMNTADRSLAMLDFAVRRRFRFIRVDPSKVALESYYAAHPERIPYAVHLLNIFGAAIGDSDLKPGHSYLMVDQLGVLSAKEWATSLASRVIHEIRPLFDEYRVEGLTIAPAKIAPTSESPDLLKAPLDEAREALIEWLSPIGGGATP